MGNWFIEWGWFVFFVLLVIVGAWASRVDYKLKEEQKVQKSFSMLKSVANNTHQEIEKIRTLHPSIKGTSVIEGINSSKYLDQGVIRDKKREYFFPINTPVVRTVDGDFRPYSHINDNVAIKVEGTVEDYTVTVTERGWKQNLKVVFSSRTGETIEDQEEDLSIKDKR